MEERHACVFYCPYCGGEMYLVDSCTAYYECTRCHSHSPLANNPEQAIERITTAHLLSLREVSDSKRPIWIQVRNSSAHRRPILVEEVVEYRSEGKFSIKITDGIARIQGQYDRYWRAWDRKPLPAQMNQKWFFKATKDTPAADK